MANSLLAPSAIIGLMGAMQPRRRSVLPMADGAPYGYVETPQGLVPAQAEPAPVMAQQPVQPAQRGRVSGWRVLDRVLGGETISQGLDAERARLQAEADRPMQMSRINAALAAIEDPREAALFLGLGGEDWRKNVAQQYAPQVLAEGAAQSIAGTGYMRANERRAVVGDRVVGLGTSGQAPRELLTVQPSYAEQTRRYAAENPTVAANSRVVNLPSGNVVAEGYVAPQITNTPAGGSTTVFRDGVPVTTVQGNPETKSRSSYEDSLGVRRFQDTGEPVFPDDFARIRGMAENRVKAADDAAANLRRTIQEALDISGAGETGLIGSVMGAVPGTRARRLRAIIETIKSNVGFNYLQQMRELSPTGGALGNVATQELQSLQSVWGNLDPNASEAQLDGVLRQMLSMVDQGQNLRAQAFASQYGAAPVVRGGSQGQSGGPVRVSSIAEARRLPSGTEFIDPNGVRRRVP